MRRYIRPLLILTGLVIIQTGNSPVCARSRPHLPAADSIRIVEAYRLNRKLALKVWPGWKETRPPLILVTNFYEFLVGSSSPDQGFQPLSSDSLMGQPIFIRSRIFPKDIFATVFYIDNKPTVVAGQPEETYVRNSTRWVLAVNHEFFHAYQFGNPRYEEALQTMTFGKADPSGSWMITYPFPYLKNGVNVSFSAYTDALDKVIAVNDNNRTAGATMANLSHKWQDILSQLTIIDSQYFSLQVWQEGVARYFEYKLGFEASENYRVTPAFGALPDFVPFGRGAGNILDNMKVVLPQMKLSRQKRLTFYYVGFAEALLLDRVSPNWKRDYFDFTFHLDDLLFPRPSLANLK